MKINALTENNRYSTFEKKDEKVVTASNSSLENKLSSGDYEHKPESESSIKSSGTIENKTEFSDSISKMARNPTPTKDEFDNSKQKQIDKNNVKLSKAVTSISSTGYSSVVSAATSAGSKIDTPGSTSSRVSNSVIGVSKVVGLPLKFIDTADKINSSTKSDTDKVLSAAATGAATANLPVWVAKKIIKEPAVNEYLQKDYTGHVAEEDGKPELKAVQPTNELKSDIDPEIHPNQKSEIPDTGTAGTIKPINPDAEVVYDQKISNAPSGNNPSGMVEAIHPNQKSEIPDTGTAGTIKPLTPDAEVVYDQKISNALSGNNQSGKVEAIHPNQKSEIPDTGTAGTIKPINPDAEVPHGAINKNSGVAIDTESAITKESFTNPKSGKLNTRLSVASAALTAIEGGLNAKSNIDILKNPTSSALNKVSASLNLANFSADAATLGFTLLESVGGSTTAGALGAAGASAAATISAMIAIPATAVATAVVIKDESKKQTEDGLVRNMKYDYYNSSLAANQFDIKTKELDSKINSEYRENPPKNVIVNNNVADTFQMMASENGDKTASGQYLKDDRQRTYSNFLEKYSDVVIRSNMSNDNSLKYDANVRTESPKPLFELPGQELILENKNGPFGSKIDLSNRLANKGYESSGNDNYERFYQMRNFQYGLNGLSMRYPSDDPRTASLTMSAGSAYLNKSVNPAGNWDLIQISDQDVEQKAAFPQMKRPSKEDDTFGNPGVARGYTSVRNANYEKNAKTWDRDAFPILATGTPVIRNPNAIERDIKTTSARKTVVEMDNLIHPVKLHLNHPDDSVVFNRLPKSDVEVILKKGQPLNIKHAYLADGESPPSLKDSDPYHFSNGRKLIVRYE